MSRNKPIIVTDSNASLPAQLSKSLGIITVPMEIHHGSNVYMDGLDISPSEFYAIQASSEVSLSTSAPQPVSYLQAYRSAADKTNQVICLTLSAELSATHLAAIEARALVREEIPNLNVQVIDSRTAGTAQGLIALAGARASANGSSTDETVSVIKERIADTVLYGILDSLYYVWRSGRVPRLGMWMGSLLSIKPILEIREGEIGMVERPRTSVKAMDRLVNLVSRNLAGRPGMLAITYANAKEQADELAARLKSEVNVKEMFLTEFTSVIGAHTGPGLVGCAVHPTDP